MPITEGIDGVSMNIINDDRTPVRATAAAQGVNVARDSVQLPDPDHWQIGLNSSVARDYERFTTESFAKKRRLESLIQTFGENISLKIPLEASVPDLLEKLKVSDGKLKEMAGKYRSTVSNAKKIINKNNNLYTSREAGHVVEMKRVLDEVASLKGARDQDSERWVAVEAELASTRTQVEEANRRTENLKAENSAAREGLIRQVEEANRRTENLKAENSERVEADATALRSSHAATIARLEEANRRNEENEEILEEIAKENEELELLADLRSNHVRKLSFERNQAKSELEELRLERRTINAEVFDIASLIPSPTEFGDLSCSFKRSFNELMFDDVPPLIMKGISKMIYRVDPCRRISRLISRFINDCYQELCKLGIDCPPKNEETIERILGRSVVETARYLLRFIDQIMSENVWNGICFLFEIDHITPRSGAFSMNRSSDFWDKMTINHHSNLQLLPRKLNRSKGNTLIAVMEKAFDSDGKFLRWEHVSHNVKQIHDTAEYMKNECHSLFNQWKTKGVESIIFDEANLQTGGHFENNLDDVGNGSETHQPDLEANQADGTQVDASDGISYLTDPTSPNLAFTLPQMATRINPFTCQLPHQAAGNVDESNRPNESLQSENSEEDEDVNFSVESENTEEDEEEDFSLEADDDPFMNPEIVGHVWQVNERSKRNSIMQFNKFLDRELQSEYFRSKTTVSIEPITSINVNDVLLGGENRTNMSGRVSRITEEAVQAFSHHSNRTDDTSRVLRMRLILKMIDELRHSTDGITCRLVKRDQTSVSMNGQLVNVIQYFEFSMKDAMQIINDRLRSKKRNEELKARRVN
jgi:hypothetical protein